MVPSPVLFCMLSKVADSTYFMLPLYVCCLIPVFSFHSGFFWVANARFRSFKHLPKELNPKAFTTCYLLLYSPCNFMVSQQFSKKICCLLMYCVLYVNILRFHITHFNILYSWICKSQLLIGKVSLENAASEGEPGLCSW